MARRGQSLPAVWAMAERAAAMLQEIARHWLNLQTRYDLMMLEDKRSQIQRRVHPFANAA